MAAWRARGDAATFEDLQQTIERQAKAIDNLRAELADVTTERDELQAQLIDDDAYQQRRLDYLTATIPH